MPTDVYALLYDDGEMAFQHGVTPKRTQNVVETYPVDLKNGYAWDNSHLKATNPWCDAGKSIIRIDFADTIVPQSTAYWFCGCFSLAQISNIGNLDTSSVTTMEGMFWGCSNLRALDLNSFDTSSVMDMSSMFYGCPVITPDLNSFNTSSVTDMKCMFQYCSSLTTLDLSSFDTSSVTDTRRMFSDCTSLATIYASERFVTTRVSDSDYMFANCMNLVGGKGTQASGYIDKTYARIDGGADNPGYFTRKS